MAYYCCQCSNFSKKDTNHYGEHWCNGWGSYVKEDKIASHCKKFCYIITKVCDILKINDSDEAINANRHLIYDVLTKNPDYYEFMKDYDTYGVEVANHIEQDSNKIYIAKYVYYNCFIPVAEKMHNKDFINAADTYVNMFYDLANYYDENILTREKPMQKIRWVYYQDM